ncbi:MAG: alpha/beta hydrolase [Myxococcales bacterium]|nr:alpha/beta hydrolase [Myxococcales bacterium]
MERRMRKGRWLSVAGALALLSLGLGCSNRLLLAPSHDPLTANASGCSDGSVLAFTATRPPIAGRRVQVFCSREGPREREPALTVLAFGGNGGRAELTVGDLRRFFEWSVLPCEGSADDPEAACGLEILSVQYPGFGADLEPATLRGLGAGALDAWDWARERGEPGRPIVVYGLSMGSTAALTIARAQAEAGEPGPAGLILDRPPHIPGIILGRHGWWNLWLVSLPVAASLPSTVHSRANARAIEATPALFLLADDDELANPRNAGKVVDAYGGPKHAAHFPGRHGARLGGSYPTVAEGLRWLWAQLGLRAQND